MWGKEWNNNNAFLLILSGAVAVLFWARRRSPSSLYFLPQGARERPHAWVCDVVHDHLGPAGMELEVVVKLGRDLAYLTQPASGHLGEVVMLVVIPHIVHENVERAVIAVCLLPWREDVVLGDEVPGDGVQAATQKHRREEVRERARARQLHEHQVEP